MHKCGLLLLPEALRIENKHENALLSVNLILRCNWVRATNARKLYSIYTTINAWLNSKHSPAKFWNKILTGLEIALNGLAEAGPVLIPVLQGQVQR